VLFVENFFQDVDVAFSEFFFISQSEHFAQEGNYLARVGLVVSSYKRWMIQSRLSDDGVIQISSRLIELHFERCLALIFIFINHIFNIFIL